MRTKLTAAFWKNPTPPDRGRAFYWDESKPGYGRMVTANGACSDYVQYRNQAGVSRRMKIKGARSLDEARRKATEILGQVAAGNDPAGERRRKKALAAEGTFRAIAENYFHREGGKLRSLSERRRDFERLIYPAFGSRQIDSIARRDVIALLDKVEDENGPRMADLVLTYVGRLFNWHAIRDDSFRSPIVRGMARTNGKERARSRILNDDELRAVWKAAGETNGPFGPFVKFVLLTATRRHEAGHARRSEIVNGVWTIPAARYKTKIDHVIPLSGAAQALLAELPQIGNCDFYFTNDGRKPIRGWARFKDRLAAASGVHGWVLHDLRRSSRSLMSRAGVASEHAERALGHVIGGVAGVYDRHRYLEEKRIAFEKLATLIESIVNPQPNVVAFDRPPRVPA